MDHMSAKFGPWKEAYTDDSLFMQILKEYDLLHHQKNRDEISKKALLLWGITLCSGDNPTKIQCFYSVLQDEDQTSIAATDPDFPHSFYLMVNFATILVNQFEPRLSKQIAEYSDGYMKNIEKFQTDLAEYLFLEKVFNAASYLEKTEWEKNVLNETQWIFDSNKVRTTVYAWIDK